MRIVFLYAEMVPSWLPTFSTLVADYGCSVDVVYWDTKKKTPYVPPAINGVSFLPRSQFSVSALIRFLEDGPPNLVFVSGWMDLGYLSALISSKLTCPVVTAFDDWWIGSARQRLASFFPVFFRRKLFSHAWVAGPRQYEFAKRMGFDDEEIILNLLTADTALFNAENTIDGPECRKNFLYVGRFSPEKGIDTLISGFGLYRDGLNGAWSLKCIGNGPLRHLLEGQKSVEVYDFAPPNVLRLFHQQAGALVVPSSRDYYPLVVHEAVSSGLPVVWSSKVGSALTYCINGFNGFSFPSKDPVSLAASLKRLESLTPGDVQRFRSASLSLASRNSPAICAASLISIIT